MEGKKEESKWYCDGKLVEWKEIPPEHHYRLVGGKGQFQKDKDDKTVSEELIERFSGCLNKAIEEFIEQYEMLITHLLECEWHNCDRQMYQAFNGSFGVIVKKIRESYSVGKDIYQWDDGEEDSDGED